MQRFDVIYVMSYKGKNHEDTALLDFEAESFAELWMLLEMGEKDGSIKQRLVNATKEDILKFDSFGFTHILNQIGECIFDIEEPEKLQLSSLDVEGNPLFFEIDEDEEDIEDDDTGTLH